MSVALPVRKHRSPLISARFALIALGVIISMLIPVCSGQVRNSFLVGIFRADGVIVPFARYSKRRWSNPWPNSQADDQSNEPKTIADLTGPWYQQFVGRSVRWRLWLSAPQTATLKTSKNVQVCSHCQRVWGLLTDYPQAKQSGTLECARNLGVASSKNAAVRPMPELIQTSEDWQRLRRFLAPIFDRIERAALAGQVNKQYASQLPPPQKRAKVNLSMPKLFRVRVPGEHRIIFYFEVSKEYPRPPEANDAGCDNISSVGGWVAREVNGKLTLLDAQYFPTDCDVKDLGLSLPFAVLELDGKTFAIVEEDSYEGESYVVLEIRRRSVRRILETYAGSC